MNATEVIDALGGTNAVARLCDVSPPSVAEWKHRGIPAARGHAIERAFGGARTVEELFPECVWVRVADPEWPHPEGRPLLDVAAMERG